jgi:hypothetical protein
MLDPHFNFHPLAKGYMSKVSAAWVSYILCITFYCFNNPYGCDSMMKKWFLAGTLAALIVAAILTAGCMTSTSPSPSPGTQTTTAAAATNVSQYLATTMQHRNFTVVKTFSLQVNSQGIASYNGTVTDRNGTYNVSVEVMNTTQDAQTRYQALVSGYMGMGYTTLEQNSTTWQGFNATSSMGAGVEYGASPLIPNYVMVLTGAASGPQAPFQQSMWSHMWDVMHEHTSDGNMGPGMSQDLSADMRSQMQNEMREHMGGGMMGTSGG